MGKLSLHQKTLGPRLMQRIQGVIHPEEGLVAAAARVATSYSWAFLLLGIYFLLASWLLKAATLPLESYFQPFLAWELIRQPLVLLPLAVLAVLFATVGRERAGLRWQTLEYGKKLRVFIGLIVLLCAWVFSAYDYNLFFNQSHIYDRLMLLALAGLALWRPVFTLPFTVLLFTIVAQFDQPLQGQYPWTEMNMVIRILVLFSATVLFYILSGRQRMKEFLIILLCLIAAFYWGSGLGKYHLNWISHQQLHLLLLGAYSNGWLAFLPSDTVVQMVKGLSSFSLPLMVFTLVVEWGAILILLRQWVARWLLLGFIAFHLGVFLVSGMFFWKWIALEVALLVLFFRRQETPLPIFRPETFLLSLILIGGGGTWFRPTNLSWYDTRLTYTLRYEGIAASGERYELPIQTFSPYTDMFTLGNFAYLSQAPQLTNIWGITQNRQMAQALVGVHTPAEVEALEQMKQRILFDQKRSEQFAYFIQTFMGHLNARSQQGKVPAFLRPPAHLWSFPRAPVFTGGERIEKVVVYRVTWLYDDTQHDPMRSEVVREIPIPPVPEDISVIP